MSHHQACRGRAAVAAMAVALLLGPASAQAQAFANRSLGLGLGAFRLLGDDSELISWGAPATLEGGYYLDAGFELYARVPLMLLYQRAFVGPQGQAGLILATGGQFGVRYLFSEEALRPFVSAHIAGLYMFRDNAEGTLPNFMGGVGLGGGLEYFVGESITLGARVYADLFVTLNRPLRFALGGAIVGTTYF